MGVNYDPDKGKRNLDNLFKEVNNVQINTIRVEESPQSNQRFGIADIEEITDAYGIGNLDPEANVNPIVVNRHAKNIIPSASVVNHVKSVCDYLLAKDPLLAPDI